MTGLLLGMSGGVVDADEPSIARPLAMPQRPGFEPNRGQWPPPVRFVARDGAATVFLTADEAVWRPRGARGAEAVRLRWPAGASPVAGPESGARVHYLHGQTRGGWQQDVPLHASVAYRGVFPGVDLIFHDQRGALEYDLVVAPGANPAAIRLTVAGAERAALDADGNLVLRTTGGTIVQHAPIAFQDTAAGRRSIAAHYVLCGGERGGAPRELAVAVGAYDRDLALVIDPSITYATDIDDTTNGVTGVAVDADGNLWLAGTTSSATFPVTDDAQDAERASVSDGYVVKLDPQGVLRYATYLGGSSFNCIGGIARGTDGSVYVSGVTLDDDFPVTDDAVQRVAPGGGGDAFLTELDASGHIVRSTYFGGSGGEQCGSPQERSARVAVATDGTLYLMVGISTSLELPADGAIRAQANQDALLVRFDERLQPLWGRFIGGSGPDTGYEVAVDGAGDAYVYGLTSHVFGVAQDFPTTPGAFQEHNDLDSSHFLAKYAPSGALLAATVFGPPSGADALVQPGDVAVDAAGNAYLAVTTAAPTMPATAGAFQPMLRGASDLFVARLTPDLSGVAWATYLGGSRAEKITGGGLVVAVHDDGRVTVGGVSESSDYPLQAPLSVPPSDQVLSTIAADGASLGFSTRVAIGTSALALGDGAIYVGGQRINRLGVGAVRIDDTTVPPLCRGDCNGDGAVQVNELVVGVRIALGQDAVAACPNFDADGDGAVVIGELVAAVGAALGGCA